MADKTHDQGDNTPAPAPSERSGPLGICKYCTREPFKCLFCQWTTGKYPSQYKGPKFTWAEIKELREVH